MTTIRPDTVFIPYHWAGRQERQPADDRRAGSDLEDPGVQGLRLPRAQGRCAAGVRRPSWSRSSDHAGPAAPRVLRRPQPLHRLPGVRAGVQRVRYAQAALDDPSRVRRPRAARRRRCRWSACTAIRRPAPRSARPTRSSAPATAWCRRARKPRCIACNNCVLACPFGVPEDERSSSNSMMKCDMCYDRTSVGQEADVRDGLPEPGAVLRHARGRSSSCARARSRSTRSSSASRRSPRKST